jgi:outer membrane protein TolC
MAVNATFARAAAAALLAAALAAPAARAEPLRLTLPGVVERSIAESHLVRAGGLDADRAREEVRKARAQRYLPKAEVSLGGGVVPAAHGTVVASPDSNSRLEDLGPFYRAELKLVQPLWTFGRLDSLESLARGGLAAEVARGELTREGVAFDAARAYWALAASIKGEGVARDMRGDFETLLRETEKRLGDESSGVDDADLFDVKSSAYSIDRIHLDALEARRLAADALAALLALPAGTEPEAVDEPSPLVEFGEASFDAAVAAAVDGNREVRALTAAAEALTRKIVYQRASRNPVFFLAAGAGYARAPNRDRQDNPWVSDDYNFSRVGAELGLTFDANLYKQNIDVTEAILERDALLEKLAGLRLKVGVDARQALRAAARGQLLLSSARTALKAAKSRLRLLLDDWETGLGDVTDVLDAYDKYYRLRAEEPQREYDLNVALARLGFVLGDVNLYLGWVQRGKVTF